MKAKEALCDERVSAGTHAVEFRGVVGWWQIIQGPTCLVDRVWVRRDAVWSAIARCADLDNPELSRAHARIIPINLVHDQSDPLSRGDLPAPGVA